MDHTNSIDNRHFSHSMTQVENKTFPKCPAGTHGQTPLGLPYQSETQGEFVSGTTAVVSGALPPENYNNLEHSLQFIPCPLHPSSPSKVA